MKEIITALNAAYQECGYVQKAGRNKEQNYKFAGEGDFIEAIRPALLKHGIIVYPSGYSLVLSENYATKSGTRMNRIVAEYTFTFHHTSGESIIVKAVGEGSDTSDKATPKAATIALKYALRQTLLIETGDDPDKETPESSHVPTAAEKASAERESRNAEKADKSVIRAAEALEPLDEFGRADWIQKNPKAVEVLKWVKANFPAKMSHLTALGVEV